MRRDGFMSVNDVPMGKNESRYLRQGDRITIVKPTFRFEYGAGDPGERAQPL